MAVVVRKKSRNNPQIWRIARWLHDNFTETMVFTDGSILEQWDCNGSKERFYDKAAELLKKINNNDFTGEDNHD